MLRGNLAPDGAVMKSSAAEPRLLRHRGPALVFENYDEMAARGRPRGPRHDGDHVLVLKNAGPQGGPGMPEWGMLPIPLKLRAPGVRDMVRISDARMSGTSYGACILHVAPESYVGGPLALVRTGDTIEVDVTARRLHLDVDDDELDRRRAAWTAPAAHAVSGYGAIFAAHVRQANEGCDFDVSAWPLRSSSRTSTERFPGAEPPHPGGQFSRFRERMKACAAAVRSSSPFPPRSSRSPC